MGKSAATKEAKEVKVVESESEESEDGDGSVVIVRMGDIDYRGKIVGVEANEKGGDNMEVKVELTGLFGSNFVTTVPLSALKHPTCDDSYRNLSLADFKPSKAEQVVEALRAVSSDRQDMQKELDRKVNELVSSFEQKWRHLDVKKDTLVADHGKLFSVPFWRKVLKCSKLGQDIEEHDEPVLEYVDNIITEWLDPSGDTGFKVIFTFRENPYFTNKTLVKTYHTQQASDWADNQDVTGIESEEIEWKAGQNVTVEAGKKRKGGGAKKKATKDVPRKSFFRSFFRNLSAEIGVPWTDPDVEEHAEEDEGEQDEEQMLQMLLQMDYESGTDLRECIIPHAIRWYTGEMELESEDEGEEGDSEDDESSSEEEPKKGKKPVLGGEKGKGKGKNDKDCKNQ